jgi:co-chaperonin GroES (HSP10)
MNINIHKINKLIALHDSVLVTEMNFSERVTSGGIVLPTDNMRGSGVRPRWGRVYVIGPEQKDVKVGQWICVAHGRWTRGVTIEDHEGEKVICRVDNNDILLVSDCAPTDDTVRDNF